MGGCWDTENESLNNCSCRVIKQGSGSVLGNVAFFDTNFYLHVQYVYYSLSATPKTSRISYAYVHIYNKECRVQAIIYSATWFWSNQFYSAFFGWISVILFLNILPIIPWFKPWSLVLKQQYTANIATLQLAGSQNCVRDTLTTYTRWFIFTSKINQRQKVTLIWRLQFCALFS